MQAIEAEHAWDHYIKCIKCGLQRARYTIGTVEDRCPNCQFKEGCCD